MTKQDFENMELAADLSFHNLPKAAQDVAHEVIAAVQHHTNPKAALVRDLDSNLSFRIACGAFDLNVPPKQTDAVVRYFELTGGMMQ
jgi:hypothetical protein